MRTKGAKIVAEVDGTPGSNDMPGRLVFSTTADNATNPTERLRIDSAGTVKINSGTLELGVEDSTNGIINAPESLFFNIDSNNDSTAENFVFAKNRTSSTGGAELMRLTEAGRCC